MSSEGFVKLPYLLFLDLARKEPKVGQWIAGGLEEHSYFRRWMTNTLKCEDGEGQRRDLEERAARRPDIAGLEVVAVLLVGDVGKTEPFEVRLQF